MRALLLIALAARWVRMEAPAPQRWHVEADFFGPGQRATAVWHGGALALLRDGSEILLYRASGTPAPNVAAADIDRNGKPDVVSAGRWFEHLRDERFHVHTIDGASSAERALAADFIPGGRVEAVFGAKLFHWTGRAWSVRAIGCRLPLDSGDVDGDGFPDLLCGDPGAVLFGDGVGGFRASPVAGPLAGARLSDIDGDGLPDVVTAAGWLRNAAPRAARAWRPGIEVWHGLEQRFGHAGRPVACYSVLGRAQTGGRAWWTLNGGRRLPLDLGPNTRRLLAPGDFNIELDPAALKPGANQVRIEADGMEPVTVKVEYVPPKPVPLPLTIDWSRLPRIEDAALVTDGRWRIENGGVRPVEVGYDRLIAIGDIGWTDYDVTVPVTVHALDSAGYAMPSVGPNAGLVLRWQGHADWERERLRQGWWPMGAFLKFKWLPEGPPVTRIFGNRAKVLAVDREPPQLGVPYLYRAQVTSPPGGPSLYRLKVWRKGAPEPAAWRLETRGVDDELKAGCLVLVAHHTDTSFGSVEVRPVPPATR